MRARLTTPGSEAPRFVLAAAGGCALFALWTAVTPRGADRDQPAAPAETSAGFAAEAPAGVRQPRAGAVEAAVERSLVASAPSEDPFVAPLRPPRTERDWHEHFLALSRADAGALARCVDAVLEEGPECRRMALLRALRDARSPAAADAFLRAFARRGATAETTDFVIRCASACSGREAWARGVLRALAFGQNRAATARDRNAAASAYAAAAPPAELWELAAMTVRAGDLDLAKSVFVALRANPNHAAAEHARAVLLPLGGEGWAREEADAITDPGEGARGAPEEP